MSLLEHWQTYEQEAVPEDADEVQREVTQQAFYAGAVALLHLVYIAKDNSEGLEDFAATMQAIEDEAVAFWEELPDVVH